MAQSITSPVFQYHSQQIRTTIIDEQIWFVAADVCKALGISWRGNTLAPIPKEWQSLRKLRNLTTQHVRIITEPAVYKLAFRSNKPEADAFTNWVASEVLPSIRKTGKYEVKQRQIKLPARKNRLEDELEALYRKIDDKRYEVHLWFKDIDREFTRLTGPLNIDVCKALPNPQKCLDPGIECLHMARYEGQRKLEDGFNFLYYATRSARFFARCMNR